MVEYLEIGKILSTHGIKGEVKVMPLTDDPKRYDNLEWVYIETKDKLLKKYEIQNVRYFKNVVVVKFKGINDINEAMRLKGLYIKVDRENAVKLPENSFFICDLIGCLVYDEEGKLLGELTDVIKTGSNDVFVVTDEKGAQILIPALKSVVQDVSIEGRKICVCLPEGLIENEI